MIVGQRYDCGGNHNYVRVNGSQVTPGGVRHDGDDDDTCERVSGRGVMGDCGTTSTRTWDDVTVT